VRNSWLAKTEAHYDESCECGQSRTTLPFRLSAWKLGKRRDTPTIALASVVLVLDHGRLDGRNLPNLMTRNWGQSPRGGVKQAPGDKKPGTLPAKWGGGMLALFSSGKVGSIAKSNVLKGSATSWKPLLRLLRHHPPEVALRLPPANGSDPSGIPVRTAARTGRPSNRVPQALQPVRADRADRTDRQETRGRLQARGKVMCFPSVGSC